MEGLEGGLVVSPFIAGYQDFIVLVPVHQHGWGLQGAELGEGIMYVRTP